MLYMYVYHAMYFMTYLNVISKAWMTDSRAKTKWTLELVTHRGIVQRAVIVGLSEFLIGTEKMKKKKKINCFNKNKI